MIIELTVIGCTGQKDQLVVFSVGRKKDIACDPQPAR